MADFEFQTRDITIKPIIYAYRDKDHPEWGYKIGETSRKSEVRIKEQQGIKRPEDPRLEVEYTASAMRADGSVFRDKDVHKMLVDSFHAISMGGEWYKCSIKQINDVVCALRERRTTATERTETFRMRPEQKAAVDKAIEYYKEARKEKIKTPKFLWNCKMRFGKTFASYELAKAMNFKKVLVLTFKPAVKTSWRDDLNTHVDFEGWQFLSQPGPHSTNLPSLDIQYERANKNKPIVCFGSLQDMLGLDKNTGTIKAHNEWVHLTNWDLVIFDEYHYGAWREKAKDLFAKENEEDDIKRREAETGIDKDTELDETFLPITTSNYLFLSGTPFRALESGEFIEEQIYSWTYSDEQKAKAEWKDEDGPNPYLSLPRMVMMTYKLPESIRKIAMQGEYNEFDLNAFFSTKGEKKEATFVYEQYIQKWLDLIRGNWMESTVEDLRRGNSAPFPFSDIKLRQALQHTLWFMPSVNSCYAMSNLLSAKQNKFYHDYKIVVCAGSESGQGAEALTAVEKAMDEPLESRTITLSCGKLTTGVTIKPWTGIFMLRNLKQPETYFQAAFRVQSPWTVGKEIIKQDCYVFDFAPNRTLRQLSEYACRLNVKELNPEKKVGDFIKFLPVLSYDANVMRQIDAGEILDIAMSGTSATLLARRWESALLVNVDNDTLSRLLANPRAMEALMKIDAFRTLNSDIETIINKSKEVKDAKREGKDKNGTPKEKKELTDSEKEYKNKRKEIQEKLIKFATRIPIFMYLTDFREVCLRDVITKLEPQLFKKVTGLYVSDFEILASIGLFNESLMNDAIYKFRRYEDSSLSYTGLDMHKGEAVGGFSTVLEEREYHQLYGGKKEIPVLKVGDKVSVKDTGLCVVTSVQKERFSVKDSKGRTHRFIYPIALEEIVMLIK